MLPVSVVVVEDQPLGRTSLLRSLRNDPRLTILTVVSDGAAAITIGRALRPDVLVTDLALRGANGLEIAAALAVTHPRIAVVLHARRLEDVDDPARRHLAALVDLATPGRVLCDAIAGLGASRAAAA